MRIFPLTFGCPRDGDLLVMLNDSLRGLNDGRLMPHTIALGTTDWPGDGMLPNEQMAKLAATGCKFFQRPQGWGNGCHWSGGIMKIAAIREMIKQHGILDDDYILSVDSDVMFTTGRIFDDLQNAGIAGPMQLHDPPLTSRFGKWSHCSGCCTFIRGSIAKAMADLPDIVYTSINEEFRRDNLATNEDILVSYMACYVGANQCPLNHHVEQNLDDVFWRRKPNGSFFHFNMPAGIFLGINVTGKWDIPKTLKMLNLYKFNRCSGCGCDTSDDTGPYCGQCEGDLTANAK